MKAPLTAMGLKIIEDICLKYKTCAANFQPGPYFGESRILFRSTGSSNPDTIPGNLVDLSRLTLQPYEAVVIDFQF